MLGFLWVCCIHGKLYSRVEYTVKYSVGYTVALAAPTHEVISPDWEETLETHTKPLQH